MGVPTKLTLCLLLVALFAPAPAWSADAADSPIRLRNRLSIGALIDIPHHGGPGFELTLSDRLRLVIPNETTGITTSVLFAGRVGLRPATGSVDRLRIRALGVRLETPKWRAELGRSAVIDGGWRLVDGVQFLARPKGFFEVGGWLGEMPDIWTTSPAPRFGGGPILRWRGRMVQVGFVGEVGGGAQGIDRLAGRLTGRFEFKKLIDVAGRMEIEAGGQGAPVRFSELGLGTTFTPVKVLRVRVGWSMHAGHSWLQGVQRDPSLVRWWQRTTGAAPTAPTPWDLATDGPTHQILGSVQLKPLVGEVPLRFALRARYNHRTVERERSARVTLEGGAYSLGGGRLDLLATGGALRWSGRWRAELGLRGWLAPDPSGPLSIEAEVRMWVGANEHGTVVPTVATDLWLDVLTPIGVTVAAGYRFDNDLDLDRWNAAHTVLLRASWLVKVGR
ncbi:MAG: hypothetical protein KDA24_01520 [Deltaproteobacteria bacterium]|nr:hypothetical protein [Deltaproteobacteria bacterium]